ncbi:MAG: hypothetical protein QM756_27620 [Polyangiaceae bacterium]
MSEVVGNAPRRVVSQAEGEDSLSFAARLAADVAESASFSAVVLLANQRADERQMLARRRLLDALLTKRSFPLWFSAAPDARPELHDELARLADELPDARVRQGESTTQPRKRDSLAVA